jgi:decaprenylphospho-beta-D-ribofuranose 2-oxidase
LAHEGRETNLPGTLDDEVLTGWAGTAPTRATRWRPSTIGDVERHLARPWSRGIIARGLGRSYGDAAQNAGGHVVDLTGLEHLDGAGIDEGVIACDAGTSLATIMASTIPRGWFPLVIPGTRFVTVGGAIAADIHGKYRHGSFASSVVDARLVTTTGDALTIGPTADAATRPGGREKAAWAATVGGMGLTGVVTNARLRLHPIETAWLTVDTERCHDIDDCMARMLDRDDRYRYSVAWIDTMARGRNLGRAVLERANHSTRAELDSARATRPLDYVVHPEVNAPPWFPDGLVNRVTIKAFNELWFRKAPRESLAHLRSIVSFFHPLDRVIGWNRVYGHRGFLQYQFVVPYGAEAVVRRALDRFSAVAAPCFLAVLKRFESASDGLMSFPMPGWTLTVDVPTSLGGLAELLDDLDAEVVAAGGRVYLAKDSRLDRAMLPDMYPRFAEWREIQAGLDPRRTMQSDLDRRLGMVDRKETS